MAQETRQLMTAEEFARLSDDGMRRELVYGEVIEMTPCSAESGRITMRVALRIAAFAERHGSGAAYTAEAGFVLGEEPGTVRAPDVAFVARERLDAIGVIEGFFPGAPDFAVEVVSPSDSASALDEKVHEYLATGTRLVWVVYPNTKRVVAHEPNAVISVFSAGQTLTAEPVLPGLAIPVDDIFAT